MEICGVRIVHILAPDLHLYRAGPWGRNMLGNGSGDGSSDAQVPKGTAGPAKWKRGRGTGMDNLEPLERKIANMHLAEISPGVIGYLSEISAEQVRNILLRPRVARYLMKMEAIHGEELAPSVEKLGDAIAAEAVRAFEVERAAMERLFGLDDTADKRFVHAQVASATIAQDILDRAGNRAPTKIQQKIEHTIPQTMVDQLGRVIGEAFGNPAAIDISPGASPRLEDLPHNDNHQNEAPSEQIDDQEGKNDSGD